MSVDIAFRAIADPTRREILDLLRDHGVMRAGDIAEHFKEMTRIAVSKHLRLLRDATLIKQVDSEDGRERVYALEAGGMDAVQSWLNSYALYWESRLSALKQIAEDAEATKEETDSTPPNTLD